MISRNWRYRVRDCRTRMTGHYQSLDEVRELFEIDDWLLGLLKRGFSIQRGKLKVDVRGKWCDNTWKT